MHAVRNNASQKTMQSLLALIYPLSARARNSCFTEVSWCTVGYCACVERVSLSCAGCATCRNQEPGQDLRSAAATRAKLTLAAVKLRPATMASHVIDLLDDDDGIEEEVHDVESIEDAMEGSGLSPEARQEEPPPPLKRSPTPDLGAETVQHEQDPEELSVAQVAEIWSELMSMRGGETTTKQLHGHTLRYQRRSADRGGDWYLHHGSEADRARPSQGRTTRSRLQFLKQFKLTSDELDAVERARAVRSRSEEVAQRSQEPDGGDHESTQ